MALFYSDPSALVKLVRDEPETAAFRTYLTDADLVMRTTAPAPNVSRGSGYCVPPSCAKSGA